MIGNKNRPDVKRVAIRRQIRRYLAHNDVDPYMKNLILSAINSHDLSQLRKDRKNIIK